MRTVEQIQADIDFYEEQKRKSATQGRSINFGDRSRSNFTLDELNKEIDGLTTEKLSLQLKTQGSSYLGLSGRFVSVD